MPRQKRSVKRLNLTVPEELADQIELYLMDPAYGKPRYGALSAITVGLWQQFIREMERPGVDPRQLMRRYGVEIEEL